MECNTCTNPREIDTPLLTMLDFFNKDREIDNNALYVNLEEEIQYNPVFFFTDLDSSQISPDKYNLFVTVKSLDNSDYMIPPEMITAKRATRYHALGHLDWTVATYQIVSEIVTTSSKHEQTIDRIDVSGESETNMSVLQVIKKTISKVNEVEYIYMLQENGAFYVWTVINDMNIETMEKIYEKEIEIYNQLPNTLFDFHVLIRNNRHIDKMPLTGSERVYNQELIYGR